MPETEIAVVGGGLVGMAVAYGLLRRGHGVTVFDEGDQALRASRGNFGLVWVQGKGIAMPDYARWTRLSAARWPELSEELTAESDVALELQQPGGLDILLSDREAEARVADLEGLRGALGGDYPFEFLGHNTLKTMVPEIGPTVVGATYCPEDGHVNPLYLLRALHGAFARRGGRLVNGSTVTQVAFRDPGFTVTRDEATRDEATRDEITRDEVTHDESWQAERVVLCAGLGNARLAPMVGLDAPLVPNRGQILVTERLQPFLHYPSGLVRQVGEGAVQIGDSKEDVGFDDGTAPEVVGAIARRAVRIFPLLETVRVVRSWGALRVMSPDGHPIYARSRRCPGAALVTCHSGVTLAAAHALVLADWIAEGTGPDYMEAFRAERFAAPAPADA